MLPTSTSGCGSFGLAPLYHVETLLGGFRVHDDRLGEAGDGLYGREAEELHSRFVSSYDRRSLARARLIRLIGTGKRKMVGDGLSKVGLLPWYRHPHVVFDFDRMVWTLR